MNDQMRAQFGAALLLLGLFVSLVELPIAGSMTYLRNGRGDGVALLLLALGSAWLAVRGRLRAQLWIALAGAIVLLFTLRRFLLQAVETRARFQNGLAGSFGGLAEKANEPVMPQWGLAVLAIGLLLLLYTGLRAHRRRR